MLKVIRQEKDRSEASSADAITHQGFALVRTSQKDKWTSMQLPFAIGSQTDSDIVVNAPTMRGVSKIVAVRDGAIVLVDAQTQEVTTLVDLKLFGIEIVGPFLEDPSQLSGVRRALRLSLNRENQLFKTKYPSFMRRILPQKQSIRVSVMAVACFALIGSYAMMPDNSEEFVDLSRQVIAAKQGNIVNLGLKSAGKKSPYSKGATIAFSTGEATSSKEYVLTLNLAGLDLNNEIAIEFNDKFIGATQAQLKCVDAYCALDYPIPFEIVKSESNTVRVIHNAPESSYEIKNIFFRSMEAATPEEIELLQQLLTSANRYHEERFLLVQNIRNARDAVEEIERLLLARTGVDAIKPKFALTKAKVMTAFQDISSDLQFRLQKELKLNHHKLALEITNDMLKLYPDPTSKQYGMLIQQKKKLEEVMK